MSNVETPRRRALDGGEAVTDGLGSALVGNHSDPWLVMDGWDEAVLLRELRGEHPTNKLAYRLKTGGKTIVGLGKEGVDFCCHVMLRQGQVIRELDVEYVIKGEGFEREAHFKAKAGRFAVSSTGTEMMLDTVIGTKRQPLYRERRDARTPDGEPVYDLNPHWYEHGAMKALRNARLRLIPPHVREQVIALSSETGRVQESPTKAQEGPQEPASDAQVKLYAQLLASHTVGAPEREKGLAWIAKKPSKRAVSQQIDALQNTIAMRLEDERRAAADA